MPKEYPPQYVHPGDTLKVSDSKGVGFEVIGLHNKEVLDFVQAFNDWVMLAELPVPVDEMTMREKRLALNYAFNKLPAHVWKELDKRAADIILPERGL